MAGANVNINDRITNHIREQAAAPIKYLEADFRIATNPISRPRLFEYYKTCRKMFWVPEEIDLSRDAGSFASMDANEQRFIEYILAFFAQFDGLVNLNLAERFVEEVPIIEARYFYQFQIMMENIHAETYSLMLETVVKDTAKRTELLNAIKTKPIIAKMAAWAYKWFSDDSEFGERLIGMGAVELIMFVAMFAAIYWVQKQGKLPGLGHANELIARDETQHGLFAVAIYELLDDKPPVGVVQDIIRECVELSKEFVNEALPYRLPEMNTELMGEYIECIADCYLTLLNVPKLYNRKNPFAFMENINLLNKSLFFERRVSEYQKLGTGRAAAGVENDDDEYEDV
ncbi:ribonucleoside-diphosphate reductase small chain [Faustovirus]|nr:ribonucleoside-diphosphate reductase small chain [Faustovirus]